LLKNLPNSIDKIFLKWELNVEKMAVRLKTALMKNFTTKHEKTSSLPLSLPRRGVSSLDGVR